MSRYINPYKDSEGFIDLGHYDIYEDRANTSTRYELYALLKVGAEALNEVALGARYSDKGEDYISGFLDTGWKYCSTKPIDEAARRFVIKLLKGEERVC